MPKNTENRLSLLGVIFTRPPYQMKGVIFNAEFDFVTNLTDMLEAGEISSFETDILPVSVRAAEF